MSTDSVTDHQPGSVLGRRALNRALLGRQGLLDRWSIPVEEAVARLVGLQSQAPIPPYFGLWTRLEGFRPDDLARLIAERRVVRAALMRATIHLVTAEDCLALRPVLQPVLTRGLAGTRFDRGLAGLDLGEVLAAGREVLAEAPSTGAALGERLAARWPGRDPASLARAVLYLEPLVQTPPRGLWGKGGQPTWTTVAAWLGRPVAAATAPDALVRRYLAAFGPATVQDVQAWSGLTRLGEVVERLRPGLVVFRNERGRELFDLPGAPRPNVETTVPPRFLPEWDNALLAHAERTRIVADGHRKAIWTVNGIVPGTILLDGFVAGTWKLERRRDAATLAIAPFAPLSAPDRAGLEEEGARLLAFAAADAGRHNLRFDLPG